MYKEQEKSIFAVFSIFVCQIIISAILPYFNVRQSVRQLIIYCVCMALPIALLSTLGNKITMSYKMPPRPVLSFFACLGLMCLTDRACMAVSDIFLRLGIQLSPDVTLYDMHMPADIAISFMTLVVLPPFAEEVIFRGLVQNKLLAYGKWQAIVFSSLLFAFFHMNLLQIPYAFVCGILFGYFTARTGSVCFAVILHFVNNLSAFVIMYTRASDAAIGVYSSVLILMGAVCAFLAQLIFELIKTTFEGDFDYIDTIRIVGGMWLRPIIGMLITIPLLNVGLLLTSGVSAPLFVGVFFLAALLMPSSNKWGEVTDRNGNVWEVWKW